MSASNVVASGYLDDIAVPTSRQLYRLEGIQDNTPSELGTKWSTMTAAQWAALTPEQWSALKP